MNAPDLIEAVVGFRGFRLTGKGQSLKSLTLFGREDWKPGERKAKCKRSIWDVSHEHKAPGADCSCGFYAYHELEYLLKGRYSPPIIAVVTARGDIEVDAAWFRAEYMTVRAITIAPAGRRKNHDWFRAKKYAPKLASKFEVPCVKFEQAEAISSFYGSVIPKEMRPKPW